MDKYVFNPDYIISNNKETDIIFTPNMDKVFILQEIESLIVNCFNSPLSIDEAISKIKPQFTDSSFSLTECIEFINKIIEFKIIIQYI